MKEDGVFCVYGFGESALCRFRLQLGIEELVKTNRRKVLKCLKNQIRVEENSNEWIWIGLKLI